MRKFRIKGLTTGVEFDLNNKKFFIYAPKNLGIKVKNEYLKIFNERFVVNSEYQYQDFSANLLFAGYKEYETFRDFVAKNIKNGFNFYYNPYPGVERYIICDISSLDKSELESDGTLRCPIVITPRSYWLTNQISESSFVEDENVGKAYLFDDLESDELFQYNYGYKESEDEVIDLFRYNYVYATAGLGETLLVNNADFETALKITLTGPCVNPYIQLVDINDNIIQDARFNITINEDEKFVINSDPKNLQIAKVNNIGVAVDETNSQDFSRTTYLTLPVGEYTLKISEDSSRNVKGVVEFKLQFRGA